MSWNIKNLIFASLVFCSFSVIAQEIPEEEEKETSKTTFLFDVGIFYPIPIGESFVAEGMETRPGLKLASFFHFEERFLLGLQMDIFGAKVIEHDITGVYDNSRVTLISVAGGYQFKVNEKFQGEVIAGAGPVRYRNDLIDGKEFLDTGASYWISPRISYFLYPDFSAFLSTSYRVDVMKTDVPPQLEELFGNVNYLSFSLGVRWSL